MNRLAYFAKTLVCHYDRPRPRSLRTDLGSLFTTLRSPLVEQVGGRRSESLEICPSSRRDRLPETLHLLFLVGCYLPPVDLLGC